MNLMNITKISPPQRAATDLYYETDLKAALDPVLVELLDIAESSGWDRRKAAYTTMFLAAQNLSEKNPTPGMEFRWVELPAVPDGRGAVTSHWRNAGRERGSVYRSVPTRLTR